MPATALVFSQCYKKLKHNKYKTEVKPLRKVWWKVFLQMIVLNSGEEILIEGY